VHDPTDETLMAYADGLLDEAQSRVLDARLASDPDLQRRLQPFVVTGRPLARLFNDTLTAELPTRLLDTIYEQAPAERRTPRAPMAGRPAAAFWPASVGWPSKRT
jgi:anti-sigma factor RsiW